ncbi:hypothetical protein C3942_15730 [Solimonas fluminis]|uniref:Uncharacterized protein n=1 Tax=Solimonas fluminis TaxID=2086571 RepID=A0A2S5TD04_9GAMM|nr:hypothetical protein [Solimonas fluminis]PPE72874.1 hypothetical protein C3942_15730 [Solimonas fluminis]
MITFATLAALLRRLLDLGAETSVMEEGLQAACGGFGLASYGIPVAPVWLPEPVLRRGLAAQPEQGSQT